MTQTTRLHLFTLAAAFSVTLLAAAQNPSAPSAGGAPPAGSNPTGAAPGPGPIGPGLGAPIRAKIDDKKFLKDATMSSMTQAELGKLAAQKASADAVKQFGQKVADQHGQAAQELKQAATKEQIKVPEGLDSKHQARIDKLAKLSGGQFDQAFMKDQVKDRQNDVRAFQEEAQDGSDPDVKAVATKLLPDLQRNLDEAKDLSKQASAK